ncbi:MAG: HEAT repeat domain-containing protein, partial [bacterium]
LIAQLALKDGMVRREARHELEKLGNEASPLLAQALGDQHENVRWEAAKALANIKDPATAPALVKALMDERFEVQWLAAEALIALGPDAVVPILGELTASYGSLYLRQGAHHVLHALERKHLLEPRVQRVVDELRSLEPLEPFPMTAKRALESLTADAEKNSGVATS